MKIIYLCQHAGGPTLGMVHANYFLAKYWQEEGNDVEIVTASQSHVRSHNPKIKLFGAKIKLEGVDYTFLRVFSHLKGVRIARLVNMFLFPVLSFFYLSSRRLPAESVLIVSTPNPLLIFTAFGLSKLFRVRMFLEVRDLWPLTPMEVGGYSAKNPLIKLMSFAERIGYVRSEKVFCVLPFAKEYMESKGMITEKFVHIPNGVDVEAYPSNLNSKNRYECSSNLKAVYEAVNVARQIDSSFILGYTGKLGPTNGVLDIIRAIRLCVHKKNIKLIVCGDGDQKTKLSAELARLDLSSNVVFLPPVPQYEVQAVLKLMDALVVAVPNSSLYTHGISSTKINEYMLSSKPILYAANDRANVVASAHCGLVSPAEDANALAMNIDNIYLMPNNQRIQIGERGRKWVMKNRSYKILANRYLSEMC